MKNFLKTHKAFVVLSIVITLVICFLIAICILKYNPNISEVWTRTFARTYLQATAQANEVFPFSVTEVVFFMTLIFCMVFLAWGCCLMGIKKYWAGANKFLAVTLIIVGAVTMYNATASMSYSRKPLELELYSGEIKKEDFKDIATYFVNDYNACMDVLGIDENGEIKTTLSRDSLVHLVRDEFKRLNSDYYNTVLPLPKQLGTSGFFTSVGIVGMYFAPFGEINYNTYSTNAELPFYICHELAHAAGVMREDDAQLLATYLMLTSDEPLFRYSAYYNTIDSLLNLLHLSDNKDDYKEVRDLISSDIWKNYRYIYDHWNGKMFLYDLGNQINDWYLKIFGQKNGTDSYHDDDPEVDGDTIISLSHYQRVYFKQYYDKKA